MFRRFRRRSRRRGGEASGGVDGNRPARLRLLNRPEIGHVSKRSILPAMLDEGGLGGERRSSAGPTGLRVSQRLKRFTSPFL